MEKYNQTRTLSMKAKIAFLVFGLTLFFTLILVLAIREQSTDRILSDQGTLLHEIAFQTSDKLDQGMYQHYFHILSLANNDNIRDSKFSNDKKRESLEFLQKYFSEFSWIGITDTNGKVLASTGKLLEGADVAKRPWFKGGLDDTFLGDVHEALLLAKLLPNPTNEPLRFVDVAAPLKDQQGKLIGVIGAHLSWQWADNVRKSLFEKTTDDHNVEVYILDKNNNILLGEKTEEMQKIANDLYNKSETKNYSIVDDYLVASHKTKGFKEYPGLGWKILIIQPLSVALIPVKEAGLRITFFGIVFAIALSTFVFYFGQKLFSPFAKLTSAVRDYGEGKKVTWPIFKNHFEANFLSKAIDDLIVSVEEKNELKIATLKAQSASEAKSKFLAHMSHEIRTPIHGIMGMGQILTETELNNEQKKYAHSIINASKNLLTIVNDVLDISKIEANKMTLEEIDFDLNDLIYEVKDNSKFLIQNKPIELKTDTAGLEKKIFTGDSQKIRQILTNLIGNAAKFTQEGFISINAKVEKQEGNEVIVRFAVTDSGIGISQEDQTKLFASFTQADSSVTRKFGGTGLGLSITKELVQLMNGDIGIISEPGQGATFWFTLKLKSYPVAASVSEARILIVDDDSDNLLIAKKALEKITQNIVLASSGNEALDFLKKDYFDLVLMDCRMPILDGFETTKKIRASASLNQNTIIIAMTADASQMEEKLALAAGMNGLLTKPIEFKVLREKVSSLLKKS